MGFGPGGTTHSHFISTAPGVYRRKCMAIEKFKLKVTMVTRVVNHEDIVVVLVYSLTPSATKAPFILA